MKNRIEKAGLQEVENLMTALTPEQRDRLLTFLQALLAERDGTATEADVMRCILGLPQEDIQPFTDILQAIGSRNK